MSKGQLWTTEVTLLVRKRVPLSCFRRTACVGSKKPPLVDKTLLGAIPCELGWGTGTCVAYGRLREVDPPALRALTWKTRGASVEVQTNFADCLVTA